MKKQTAVDMFCLTISDHIEAIFNGSIQQDEFAKRMRQSYNEAKALEKQQIIEAINYGCSDFGSYKNAEECYESNYE
jgi:hypothetical protein